MTAPTDHIVALAHLRPPWSWAVCECGTLFVATEPEAVALAFHRHRVACGIRKDHPNRGPTEPGEWDPWSLWPP